MQTDKKGLSKREKRLLMVMVVFGLFAVMVIYVIIPFYNELEDKSALYMDLEYEKIQIEMALAGEQRIANTHKDAFDEYNRASRRFLSESLSNEVGRMLTALCEDHELQPLSLNLSAPRIHTTGMEAVNDPDSVFLITSAIMTVRGEYDDIKGLLDTVGKSEYIKVGRLSFGWQTTGEFTYLDVITINFEVTMLEDLDV